MIDDVDVGQLEGGELLGQGGEQRLVVGVTLGGLAVEHAVGRDAHPDPIGADAGGDGADAADDGEGD